MSYSPSYSLHLTCCQPPPYPHLPVMSYSPSYPPHRTQCRSCRLGRAHHPPPHRHHTHCVLLALLLAAMILTTTLPTYTALVASHLSSHSSCRMAQHPTVSDTLRAALTSQRSPTYSHRTRCRSRHMILPTVLLINIYPSHLTRHRTRRNLLAVVIATWVVPAIPLIGIIHVLLTIVLAARILTTFLLIDSVLAVSYLLSHSSRRMAQHPTVSDTLRAALTSLRSQT